MTPSQQQTPDMVNHPPHYTSHPSGVECITITEHMNFNIGNAVKYLWRADLKNGIEDLEKAAWYVNRELARRNQLEQQPDGPVEQRLGYAHPSAPIVGPFTNAGDPGRGSGC